MHNTEGEQDKTDCPNQAENKIGQITDYGEGVIGRRKRGDAAGEDNGEAQHHSGVDTQTTLTAIGQAVRL